MECKHMEKLLSPYLDGDLDNPEKRSVENHLEECGSCREMLSLMQEVNTSLQTFPEAEISPSLQKRLLSIPERKQKFRFSFDLFVKPTFQPVLAAATVLLTVVSFYAFSPQRSSINKSIELQLHLGYHKIGQLYTRAESFSSSLMGYKDNLMVSLQDKNPLRKEDQ